MLCCRVLKLLSFISLTSFSTVASRLMLAFLCRLVPRPFGHQYPLSSTYSAVWRSRSTSLTTPGISNIVSPVSSLCQYGSFVVSSRNSATFRHFLSMYRLMRSRLRLSTTHSHKAAMRNDTNKRRLCQH